MPTAERKTGRRHHVRAGRTVGAGATGSSLRVTGVDMGRMLPSRRAGGGLVAYPAPTAIATLAAIRCSLTCSADSLAVVGMPGAASFTSIPTRASCMPPRPLA